MIADTHKLSALKKFVEFHEDGRRAEFWSPQGPAQVPFKVQLTLGISIVTAFCIFLLIPETYKMNSAAPNTL